MWLAIWLWKSGWAFSQLVNSNFNESLKLQSLTLKRMNVIEYLVCLFDTLQMRQCYYGNVLPLGQLRIQLSYPLYRLSLWKPFTAIMWLSWDRADDCLMNRNTVESNDPSLNLHIHTQICSKLHGNTHTLKNTNPDTHAYKQSNASPLIGFFLSFLSIQHFNRHSYAN